MGRDLVVYYYPDVYADDSSDSDEAWNDEKREAYEKRVEFEELYIA